MIRKWSQNTTKICFYICIIAKARYHVQQKNITIDFDVKIHIVSLFTLFLPSMKSTIISISDNNKHFSSAISEYIKRLGKDLEIIDIKPEKNGTREHIIQKETQKLLQYIEKKSSWANKPYIVLLAKEGKQLTTEQCVKIIEKNPTFVIGWPYWVDLGAFDTIPHEKIAFGNITLPHGLAKLVLLEQIYRAKMIHEGREYHY